MKKEARFNAPRLALFSQCEMSNDQSTLKSRLKRKKQPHTSVVGGAKGGAVKEGRQEVDSLGGDKGPEGPLCHL